MLATNQVEKKHRIEDIGVQTDRPNRRYSTINWEGYQPWKLIQWISSIWSVWQKLLLKDLLVWGRSQQRISSIWLVFWSLGFWPMSPPSLKKMRGFATYVPPSLSFASYLPLPLPIYHYLPLPVPTQLQLYTCHILPLPASFFHSLYLPLPASLYLPLHYLPLPATTSACQYLPLFPPAAIWHYLHLPLPAATCHCLPLSVTTWLPASTSICHHLQLPTCLNLSPDPVAEIANDWNYTTDQDTKQPSKVPPGGSDPEYFLFGLFFETLVFDQHHLQKRQNNSRICSFFLQRGSVANGPPFPGEDAFATP